MAYRRLDISIWEPLLFFRSQDCSMILRSHGKKTNPNNLIENYQTSGIYGIEEKQLRDITS